MTRDDQVELLKQLEDELPQSPPATRPYDVQKINTLRLALGMEPYEQRAVPKKPERPKLAKPVERDLSAARSVYGTFLLRYKELQRLRAYAHRVCVATHGSGMTPVKPLATMGTDGGCLLCDHCKEPIVLEGGKFHGVPVDRAWAKRTTGGDDWKSYIAGGMVVEIAENGTLRIYHGYIGQKGGKFNCCNARELEESQPITIPPGMYDDLRLVIAEAYPDQPETRRAEVLREVIDVMYHTEIGTGVNQPPEE